jgi:hypothetical protein
MPGICQTALAAIAELRGEHSIEPTPDEIVRLHELGARVEDPEPGERLALLGCPVKCGNAVLFRLTITGSLWWKELACNWWVGNDTWLTASLAFAMAHGRTPGALPLLRDTAQAAVKAWYRTLTVNRAQLDAAILESLADESDDRADEIVMLSRRLIDLCGGTLPKLEEILRPFCDKQLPARNTPVDWEAIAHDLSLSTGTAPDYWLHESRQIVLRAWIRAKRIDMARTQLGSEPDNTAQTKAIIALRNEITAIIKTRATPSASASASKSAPTP